MVGTALTRLCPPYAFAIASYDINRSIFSSRAILPP
jgi:hypothetical protein